MCEAAEKLYDLARQEGREEAQKEISEQNFRNRVTDIRSIMSVLDCGPERAMDVLCMSEDERVLYRPGI